MQASIRSSVFTLAALLASPALAQSVPDAIAAPREVVVTKLHAEGAQLYQCKENQSGQLAWQFREPIASLLDGSKTVGRHYAGPHWELADGSVVKGRVAASVSGATSLDIPLLKLEVTEKRGTGLLADVTTVQRINTRGGVADGMCPTAGAMLSVPYSADYVFLRKTAE